MTDPAALRNLIPIHDKLYTLTICDSDGHEMQRLTTNKAFMVTREVGDFIQREGLDNTGGRRRRGRTDQLNALLRGEGPIEIQGFTIHVTITTKGKP